ncbi:MAG: hypothetical protein U0990_01875 [Candidatus Nanopelagicales bacterium]|nr:hypothetical protein [Candidatus Nanopelagicales bacterium]
MTLEVRAITAAQHATFISTRPWVPIQQTPGWGRGHVTGRYESIGWFDKDFLVGAGLARYRGLPRLPMRSVASFHSGPDIDWTGLGLRALRPKDWLDPLVEHLRSRGAFTARVGPMTSAHVWPGFHPTAVSQGTELAIRASQPPTHQADQAHERLRQAGWRVMRTARKRFLAEVPLPNRQARPPDPPGGGTPTPRPAGRRGRGLTIRPGDVSDLDKVASAIGAAHPHEDAHSPERMHDMWRGLAGDDHDRVRLLVAESMGDICYGSMFAIVGAKAWDLSENLTEPTSNAAAVLALRTRMLAESTAAGATAFVVPSGPVPEGALMPRIAWGWPSVRLTELLPSFQYPVRATWHSTLTPIVNRMVR